MTRLAKWCGETLPIVIWLAFALVAIDTAADLVASEARAAVLRDIRDHLRGAATKAEAGQ